MSRQHRLLQRDLSSEDGVETATGIMVERKLNLEKGYRRALAKAFQTHPHQIDFTKPDQAVSIINSWVLDHTAGIHTTHNSMTSPGFFGTPLPPTLCGLLSLFPSLQFPLTPLFSSEGAIPEFLEPGSLTDETRLVLLNALHFQALWKVPFDPKFTQERMFHCANGSIVPVHMMRLTNRFNYGRFNTDSMHSISKLDTWSY